MRADYLTRLPARIAELEDAAAPLTGDASPEAVRGAVGRLHALSHKLAGSGTTFGFPEVSKAARAIEDRCAVTANDETAVTTDDREELAALVGALSALGRTLA